MPFTFKISKRLACSRRWAGILPAAAVVAGLVACSTGEHGINAPSQNGSAVSAAITPPPYAELLRENFEATGFGSRGWYDFRVDPTITDTTHASDQGST